MRVQQARRFCRLKVVERPSARWLENQALPAVSLQAAFAMSLLVLSAFLPMESHGNCAQPVPQFFFPPSSPKSCLSNTRETYGRLGPKVFVFSWHFAQIFYGFLKICHQMHHISGGNCVMIQWKSTHLVLALAWLQLVLLKCGLDITCVSTTRDCGFGTSACSFL